jgi:hypothetical protein
VVDRREERREAPLDPDLLARHQRRPDRRRLEERRADASAWYYNVQKDPNVTVEVGNETFEATAKVEEGAERDRLWAQHVEQLPRFGEYPAQTGGRVIPTIRLTPKG